MNPKFNAPAFPPQVLLDQFQRPVAPIPGMSQLDYFALKIFCTLTSEDDSEDDSKKVMNVAKYAINQAETLLDALHRKQSESQISELKIIDNES